MKQQRRQFPKVSAWLKVIFGLVVIVVLLVIAGFFFSSKIINLQTRSSLQRPAQAPGSQQSEPTPPGSSVFLPLISEPSQTQDIRWEIYIDPIYHFSIKYPANWAVYRAEEGPEKDRRVEFIARPLPLKIGEEETPRVSITVYDNSTGLLLQDWMRSQLLQGASSDIRGAITPEQIEIAGLVGIATTQLPSRWGSLDVFLSSDQYIYRFALTPYDLESPTFAESSKELSQLFYEMLGTFEVKRTR